MPGLYTRKGHERELRALREAYDGKIGELQAALAELKEENRRLSAEVSFLSAQKQAVSEAMIAAGESKKQMEAELGEFVRSEKALAVQAAEKAQALLEEIRAAYPDRAETARFARFERRLDAILSGREDAESAEDAADAVPDCGARKEFNAEDGEWKLEQVLETLGLADD